MELTMPLLQEYSSIHAGVWHITEDEPTLLQLLDDPSFEAELKSVHSDSRRKEKLACRLLLKALLGRVVKVSYSEEGAPYLPYEPYQVSFTHTKDYAAVILSHETQPGIDIEYRSERIRKIRQQFLSPNEETALPDDCPTSQLLIRWCAKEALYKMLPHVEAGWFPRFEVSPFEESDAGTLSICDLDNRDMTCTKMSFVVTPQFVLVYSLGR